MNSTDQTKDTTQQSRRYILKILSTTTTICGENCDVFMDSRKFINQEIYLVNVDHNGMAAHLTGSGFERF